MPTKIYSLVGVALFVAGLGAISSNMALFAECAEKARDSVPHASYVPHVH